MIRFTLTVLAGVSGLALTSAAALAQDAIDAAAFLSHVEAVYESSGYTMQFAAGTADGDTVSSPGLKIGIAGLGEIKITAEFVFTGVASGDDGSYAASELNVGAMAFEIGTEENPGMLEIESLLAANLNFPVPSTTPSIEDLLYQIGSITAGPIVVRTEEGRIATIDQVSSVTEPESEDPMVMVSTTEISGIMVDFAQAEEEAAAALQALGITTVTGNFTQVGRWDLNTGAFDLSTFDFTADDLASLTLGLSFAGLTGDLITAIQAQNIAIQSATEAGNTEAAQQATAAMGVLVMSQLSVGPGYVRYDDQGGFTDRLIDLIAAGQPGSGRAEMIDDWLRMVDTTIQVPGLEATKAIVLAEIEEFLNDPQSFEVSISPPAPVLLLQFAAAMAAPQLVVQQLVLAIEANEAASAE